MADKNCEKVSGFVLRGVRGSGGDGRRGSGLGKGGMWVYDRASSTIFGNVEW